MESLRIDILNPKVKAVLKELAALNLIRIQSDSSDKELQLLLKKMRMNKPPTLEEIQNEVEIVRKKRHKD
jgi:hypothetical protein